MTFKEWIIKYINVDLPVSELAKFIAADDSFPQEAGYDFILNYLKTKDADTYYIDLFKLYYNAYFNEPCR